VPDSGSPAGELVALLTTEMLPVTLPAIVGANVTLNPVFCPAARVWGRGRSLILKPVPVTVALERVTVAVPVFFRITGIVLLPPRMMFPKLVLVGFVLIRSVIPVPESDAVVKGLPRLSVFIETLPLTLPVAAGANVALKVVVWPPARVSGKTSPLMLKPVPVTVPCVIFKMDVPVLVRVTL
jgi:hypothetical protein